MFHRELCSLLLQIGLFVSCFFRIGTKKRTFHSNDVKFAIYTELLARTDPPVLHHEVTSEVANKFDVPLLTVQGIWHKDESVGLQAIKNKMPRAVGRKRIEIASDAIQAIDLAEYNLIRSSK
jgi:hypothetical protein